MPKDKAKNASVGDGGNRLAARATVTFVYTDDLARASAFYERTLGLPLVVDQGPCRLYRAAPTSLWGVCDLADRPREAAGVTLTLVYADEAAVDAAFEAAVARGARIAHRPRAAPRFGVYAGLLASPDGHRIEMQTLAAWRTNGAADGDDAP